MNENQETPVGEPTFGEVKAEIHEMRFFNIPVSGVDDVRSSETVTISPQSLRFKFTRHYKDGDPKPPWRKEWPSVRGPRRLNSGALSENSAHSRTFYPHDKDIPAWVTEQVEKHRPPQDS